MLVVFQAAPRPTPLEAVLKEEPVAQVACHELVAEGTLTVGIAAGGGRLNGGAPVTPFPYARVVERVDVYGHAPGMGGETSAARHLSVVEAACIVGTHRLLIVGIIVIDERHALYGVPMAIELAEDVEQVGSDGTMAHQLTLTHTALRIVMRHAEIAQLSSRHGTVFCKRLSLHAGKDLVGQSVGRKLLSTRLPDEQQEQQEKNKRSAIH